MVKALAATANTMANAEIKNLNFLIVLHLNDDLLCYRVFDLLPLSADRFWRRLQFYVVSQLTHTSVVIHKRIIGSLQVHRANCQQL